MTLSNPAAASIVLQYASCKQITDDISNARFMAGYIIYIYPTGWQELAQARLQELLRHANSNITTELQTQRDVETNRLRKVIGRGCSSSARKPQ